MSDKKKVPDPSPFPPSIQPHPRSAAADRFALNVTRTHYGMQMRIRRMLYGAASERARVVGRREHGERRFDAARWTTGSVARTEQRRQILAHTVVRTEDGHHRRFQSDIIIILARRVSSSRPYLSSRTRNPYTNIPFSRYYKHFYACT